MADHEAAQLNEPVADATLKRSLEAEEETTGTKKPKVADLQIEESSENQQEQQQQQQQNAVSGDVVETEGAEGEAEEEAEEEAEKGSGEGTSGATRFDSLNFFDPAHSAIVCNIFLIR